VSNHFDPIHNVRSTIGADIFIYMQTIGIIICKSPRDEKYKYVNSEEAHFSAMLIQICNFVPTWESTFVETALLIDIKNIYIIKDETQRRMLISHLSLRESKRLYII